MRAKATQGEPMLLIVKDERKLCAWLQVRQRTVLEQSFFTVDGPETDAFLHFAIVSVYGKELSMSH